MSEKEIGGSVISVDAEGYLTDPSQWTKEIAGEIAREIGIESLTDGHWKVIDFLRREFEEKGSLPTLRRIKNAGGVPTKDLYQLFPDGPLKKAAKIAGLSKPASCV